MQIHVLLHEGVEQGAGVFGEGTTVDQDLAQAFMASTRASRVMKSICKASTPKRRLRSADMDESPWARGTWGQPTLTHQSEQRKSANAPSRRAGGLPAWFKGG
jgi:hypothetical protein